MNRTIARRAAVAFSLVAVAATAALAVIQRPAAEEPAIELAAPASSINPSATPLREADFAVVIDQAVQPARAQIEGLETGQPARPLGRIESDEEGGSDVVLDELIVSTTSAAELDAFLGRWNGTLLDSFPAGEDGLTDHLVQIDPSTIDPSSVAADLAAFEAHDDLRVSDERTLRLLAILAAETSRHGTAVTLNPLPVAAEVEDGEAQESGDQSNPFTWSYLKAGGAQDFAVAPAWQLLEANGKLERTVTILVHDGGFSHNPDFPEDSTIRSAKWGEANRMDCGDNPCPYHGTHVALTVAGQLDNEYGTVGPAGPVVDELIVVAVYSDQWKRLRNLADMVDLYRPDIVNMSYSSHITVARNASQDAYDRRFKAMRDRGALLFASAGNQGLDVDTETCVFGNCSENRLVMPCESTYVVCVGGVAKNSIERDPSSNFGQDDDRRSVELWGPYWTVSINDPNRTYLDFTTRWVSGTSFSSPFVAGIGALVKAADPSIGPDEIRDILNVTANDGVPGQWMTGSHRRVDALAAVAEALGVELGAPEVAITSPKNGKDYAVSNWLQLKGTATDYRGVALPIRWESSLDGELGNQVGTVSLGALSVGTHALTATAVDAVGQETTASISFEVVHRPVDVTISSPADGTTIEEGDPLALAAGTSDPDNYHQSLAEDDVRWLIRRTGNSNVIWERNGHDHLLDGSVLAPGSYALTFEANGPAGTVSKTHEMVVKALPPGHTKPAVTITKPAPGTVLSSGGGAVEVQLAGHATDQEDGVLSGTRFRWIATAGGETVVLCTGSGFTGPSDGGIGGLAGPVKDCAGATVELEPSPLAPGDFTWQLTLEARDHAGDIGRAVVNLDIEVHVG